MSVLYPFVIIYGFVLEATSLGISHTHSHRYTLSNTYLSQADKIDEFFSSGEACDSQQNCAFKCLAKRCHTWAYNEMNSICVVFPDYPNYHLMENGGGESNYIQSTLHYGRCYFVFHHSSI